MENNGSHAPIVTTFAGLLAAIPALLGFTPHNSVVAVGFVGPRVLCVIRVDANPEATLAQAAVVLARHNADSVMLIAVAERGTAASDHALTVIANSRDAFTIRGIDITANVHTDAIAHGASWLDHETGEAGLIDDPTLSPATTATIMEGRAVRDSRDAIADSYTPTTSDWIIGDATDEAHRTAAEQGADHFAATTLAELVAVTTTNEQPSLDLAARAGILITENVEARDAMLSIGRYPAAIDVTAAIARQTAGQPRIEALTVAGYAAYVRGDGAAANIALDAAETEADAHHLERPRLLGLLRAAVEAGITPTQLAEIGNAGTTLMTDRFGVELPE